MCSALKRAIRYIVVVHLASLHLLGIVIGINHFVFVPHNPYVAAVLFSHSHLLKFSHEVILTGVSIIHSAITYSYIVNLFASLSNTWGREPLRCGAMRWDRQSRNLHWSPVGLFGSFKPVVSPISAVYSVDRVNTVAINLANNIGNLSLVVNFRFNRDAFGLHPHSLTRIAQYRVM